MKKFLFPPLEGPAICFEFIALLCHLQGVILLRHGGRSDAIALFATGAAFMFITRLSASLPDIPSERELRRPRELAATEIPKEEKVQLYDLRIVPATDDAEEELSWAS